MNETLGQPSQVFALAFCWVKVKLDIYLADNIKLQKPDISYI